MAFLLQKGHFLLPKNEGLICVSVGAKFFPAGFYCVTINGEN